MIVLDTTVVSELMKAAPAPEVLAFVRAQSRSSVFTAAVCVAEIRYGIARLPSGRRSDELTARFAEFLALGFEGQILQFDSSCATHYCEIRAAREAAGRPISTEDALIAATARAHRADLATRNVDDFEGSSLRVINPWQPA